MAQTLPDHNAYPTAKYRVYMVYFVRSAGVLVNKLQQPKEKGGWAMPDTGLKCGHHISRIRTLSKQVGSMTAALMRDWNLKESLPNSYMPNVTQLKTLTSISIP